MNSDTIRQLIVNARDPLDAKQRINFTSRGMLLFISLFKEKTIDVIELHSLLLRIYRTHNCFIKDSNYITCKDIIVYFTINTPSCITIDHIIHVVSQFDINQDNEHKEVETMKLTLLALTYK